MSSDDVLQTQLAEDVREDALMETPPAPSWVSPAPEPEPQAHPRQHPPAPPAVSPLPLQDPPIPAQR